MDKKSSDGNRNGRGVVANTNKGAVCETCGNGIAIHKMDTDDSRPRQNGEVISRMRVCPDCGWRTPTQERPRNTRTEIKVMGGWLDPNDVLGCDIITVADLERMIKNSVGNILGEADIASVMVMIRGRVSMVGTEEITALDLRNLIASELAKLSVVTAHAWLAQRCHGDATELVFALEALNPGLIDKIDNCEQVL